MTDPKPRGTQPDNRNPSRIVVTSRTVESATPENPNQFERFETLTTQLLSVSKSDLDAERHKS